ncbi:MAG: nucleotide exchange factor GrpE [Spirochaetales bacterium]|nr:nucleotide exchange factor GrpE [Spirochaetales bacterium]
MSRKKKNEEYQEQEVKVKESKNDEDAIKSQDNSSQNTDGQEVNENINEADQTAQMEQDAQKVQEEILNLKDQLLRKQAEFENFRKRIFKEKEDAIKYSNQMLLLDLTSVIDDFERAMKSADESKDFDTFHKGVVMIEKQLVSLLEKNWGLKRFDSTGEVFDPEKHQAIAVEESTEHDTATVLEDYQKGYYYNDRILRPAKVKIAQPTSNASNFNNNNNDNNNNKEN